MCVFVCVFCVCVCLCMCCVFVDVCVCVYVYVYVHVCVFVFVYVCVFVYICVCVCICIFTILPSADLFGYTMKILNLISLEKWQLKNSSKKKENAFQAHPARVVVIACIIVTLKLVYNFRDKKYNIGLLEECSYKNLPYHSLDMFIHDLCSTVMNSEKRIPWQAR